MPHDFSSGEAPSFSPPQDQETRTIDQLPLTDRAYFSDIIAAADIKRRQDETKKIVAEPTRTRLREVSDDSGVTVLKAERVDRQPRDYSQAVIEDGKPIPEIKAMKANYKEAIRCFVQLCDIALSEDEINQMIESPKGAEPIFGIYVYREGEPPLDVRLYPPSYSKAKRLPYFSLPRVFRNAGGPETRSEYRKFTEKFKDAGIHLNIDESRV